MKEDYLHFLWRMRFLPSRNLQLEDGTELEIIEFGEYNNNESGPDFFHAKLIIDGLLWFGHVEFHLKSSDWFKHGHQNDPAYDHVILHVVWEDDVPVSTKGKQLPTLLMSRYVLDDYSSSHQNVNSSPKIIPCSYALDEVPIVFIEREKEKALVNRLSRKTETFQQDPSDGFKQILYELIASSFGAKVNKDAFWQLTKEVPIMRLLKMSQSKRKESLLSASGIFETHTEIPPPKQMQAFQWKRKGLHPKGAPAIRVQQFAQFIAHFDFDFGFLDLEANELIDYIRAAFKYAQNPSVRYSKSFQELIIINSFVPFLWWLGEKRGEEKWQSLAIQMLQILPSEQNHLIHFLKKAGFEMTSAYDSQALMELYSLRCSRKKCLTCGIGNHILRA